MNGRRRSGAWFQKRPLSALPDGFRLLAAICLEVCEARAKPGSQSAVISNLYGSALNGRF